MNYQIKIIKAEANPNYKEEMAAYRKELNADRIYNRNYSDGSPIQPKEEFIKDVLICELTEEQFRKVKSEVFKTFE
jgi:hypothetical protein